jgi:AcrR family transcriptional regulator
MPKITGASISEHREQTRARLYASLSTLMADRGFDSITLADIAAGAGVSRTAVYNHVPDKETLLLDFITEETRRYIATLEAELADVPDPTDQMRIYLRHYAKLRQALCLMPGPDLRAVVSPAAQHRLREHVGPVESVLRRILAAGIATGAFADHPIDTTVTLINACLASRTLHSLNRGDEEAATAAAEAFVLRAIGAEEVSV